MTPGAIDKPFAGTPSIRYDPSMDTIPVLHPDEIEEDRPMPSRNHSIVYQREFHAHGVQECWVVIPGTETISIYPQSGPSHSIAEGVARNEDLQLEVVVAEVFSQVSRLLSRAQTQTPLVVRMGYRTPGRVLVLEIEIEPRSLESAPLRRSSPSTSPASSCCSQSSHSRWARPKRSCSAG